MKKLVAAGPNADQIEFWNGEGGEKFVRYQNALDLMLICVESGMSIETSFRKVAQEIGTSSLPLAEELSLTTAELSFLPDRRQELRFSSDRRSGQDRRPRRGWEPGSNL